MNTTIIPFLVLTTVFIHCKYLELTPDIYEISPNASFKTNSKLTCTDFNIEFKNTSNGLQSIKKAVWDFGDGSFSNELDSTVHRYLISGSFIVSLTVYTNYDSATSSELIVIKNVDPITISWSIANTGVNHYGELRSRYRNKLFTFFKTGDKTIINYCELYPNLQLYYSIPSSDPRVLVGSAWYDIAIPYNSAYKKYKIIGTSYPYRIETD